ncbi:MAG: putative spermidine/putrescine transporter [Haloplasmataceae bacterium]|jgi:spermidine/putrescine transport system permease protein|nr:putative spermidine/putrescine transporter [Haloplasmataceae bacterium]
MKDSNKHLQKLAIPYIVWMVIFILLPMFLIFLYSITEKNTGLALYNIHFTLNHFKEFFTGSENYKPLIDSLWLALLATFFSLIVGYPVAYILSFKLNPKIRNIFLILVILPMWTNMLLRTYSLKFLINENGYINKMIETFNNILPFNIPYLSIMDTTRAVIMGMTYNYLPFMILPVFAVLIKLDKDLINAAYDLGANKFWTFVKVILPLSLPGIITGTTMVFLPAATSFIIPMYLGGNNKDLIGNLIETQFIRFGNPNFGSAISLVLIIFIFGFTKLLSLTSKNNEKGESLW